MQLTSSAMQQQRPWAICYLPDPQQLLLDAYKQHAGSCYISVRSNNEGQLGQNCKKCTQYLLPAFLSYDCIFIGFPGLPQPLLKLIHLLFTGRHASCWICRFHCSRSTCWTMIHAASRLNNVEVYGDRMIPDDTTTTMFAHQCHVLHHDAVQSSVLKKI